MPIQGSLDDIEDESIASSLQMSEQIQLNSSMMNEKNQGTYSSGFDRIPDKEIIQLMPE